MSGIPSALAATSYQFRRHKTDKTVRKVVITDRKSTGVVITDRKTGRAGAAL